MKRANYIFKDGSPIEVKRVKEWKNIPGYSRDYGTSVKKVYGRPSQLKLAAEEDIKRVMSHYDGYGYRITGRTRWQFSAIWFFESDDGTTVCVKETPTDTHYYAVECMTCDSLLMDFYNSITGIESEEDIQMFKAEEAEREREEQEDSDSDVYSGLYLY